MALPDDVHLLRSAPDSPAAELGIEWSEEGESPYDYHDLAELSPQLRRACVQMFQELVFIATGPDGEDIALWKHRPDLPLERAPIVTLDSEGQLECRAATFADFLVRLVEDPRELRSWCAAHGIDSAPTVRMVDAKVRLLPNPQDRWAAMQQGEKAELPIRTADPRALEDLIGMAGSDPRVVEFLELVEMEENPLEVRCDGAGRVVTIFASPESIRVPFKIRGVSLGAAASSLDSLGPPGKTGKNWSRWDSGELALHVEFPNQIVSRITLMLRSSLPPHLR